MMDNLNGFVADSGNVGKEYSSGDKTYTIAKIDNFSYTDPVDSSVSKNQVNGIVLMSLLNEKALFLVQIKTYRLCLTLTFHIIILKIKKTLI